jgi:NADH-quinone oxidoreductase subunit H
MWIRFTVPRLRIDHLMAFNWKFLVPLSIFNLLLMAFIWKAMPEPTETGFWADVPRTLVMLAGNIVLVVGLLVILRSYAAKEREKVEALVDETDYRPSRPSIAVGD